MSDPEHKLQGRVVFRGLQIAIENQKGSVRSGVNRDGKPWHNKMTAPYGYVVGSKGADKEGVDVFVGPDKKAPSVFVVHQKKDDGSYDEDKCVLGVESKEEARKLYLSNYDTKKYLGPISEVPIERFKKIVSSGEPTTKISSVLFSAFIEELQEILRA
jgi:hypothetical protein